MQLWVHHSLVFCRDMSNNSFKQTAAPDWFSSLLSLTTLWVLKNTQNSLKTSVFALRSRVRSKGVLFMTLFCCSGWLNMDLWKDQFHQKYSVYLRFSKCESKIHEYYLNLLFFFLPIITLQNSQQEAEEQCIWCQVRHEWQHQPAASTHRLREQRHIISNNWLWIQKHITVRILLVSSALFKPPEFQTPLLCNAGWLGTRCAQLP